MSIGSVSDLLPKNKLYFAASVISLILLLVGSGNVAMAATIVVPAGGDLQAALNAVQCGDTIVIQSGARFVTPGLEIPAIILRNKPCTDTSWITIQPENASSLPATFRNLTPQQLQALNLPKIVSNTATPAVEAEGGSNHYRIIGIEITNDSRNKTTVNNGLVFAGIRHGSSPNLTLATVPHDIEFDRTWVHGEEDGTDSALATCLRGFWLGAKDITIKNSRLGGFRAFYPGSEGPGASSQAILIEKGPGPYTISNNYLEAWFATIFTGGGPQWITNQATVASDATTTRATLSNVNNLSVGDYIAFKVTGQSSHYQVAKVTGISGNTATYVPQSGLGGGTTGNPLLVAPASPGDAVWNGDTPKNIRIINNTFWKNPIVGATAGALGFYGKGHIEFKTATDTLVEGNDFSGFAAGFTITSRNQSDEFTSGNNPWATIKNLMFRNNRWRGDLRRGTGAVIGIQLNDNNTTTVPGHNVTFENMLFENLWVPLLSIGGSENVTFRHVTAIGGIPDEDISMFGAHSEINEGFRLEDNILQNNEYGLNCSLPNTAACYPNYVMTGNVVLDNRTPAQKAFAGPLSNRYPAGNFYPDFLSQFQFIDISTSQWGLASTSPYKGLGSNGTDPGVDMTRLLAAMGGVLLPPPTPTPTPSPSSTPTPSPSPSPSPTPAVGTFASFVGEDATTQGDWQGVYGIDGHNVISDSATYPSYVAVTPNSQDSYVWDENSSDSRALQKSSSSDRIAACWYSTSMFSVDVNLTDGQAHQLALYVLDWDSNERVQRIDILDATYNTVLDSRTLSSFGAGKYLVWYVRGHVRIKVTGTAGLNGVISGLFFGPLPASTPISPASVNRAKLHAGDLVNGFPLLNYNGAADSENASVDVQLIANLEALTTDIAFAYQDFNNERSIFGAVASQIESQLLAALAFSRSQAALAAKTGATSAVRNHLLRIASHLAMAEDLMRTGAISQATADQAAAVNARIDVLLGPAHAGYGINSSALLAPLSLGSVFGDEVLSPFGSQTLFAPVGSDGSVGYELAGVNVTVSGKAVPVMYVSPSRVSFYVAPDVAQGSVEVIVTSQDGFVSRGITTIAPNATRLMTASDDGSGTAIALNESRQTVPGFDAITPENFGPDKRTRVTLYATGISGSAINLNPTNDIPIAGVLWPRVNFAETVIVEARLSNGTVINLPVEFAGTQGLLPGLDQVTIVLTSELAGAGTVELTLIVGGQRSNGPTIVVQ